MLGPFSRDKVESILGPFQCSPLSVNVQDQGPSEEPKLRVIRNLSKGSRDIPSTNDYIDTENFPTRFGSAAQVAKIVSTASLPYISHIRATSFTDCTFVPAAYISISLPYLIPVH